MTIPTTVSTGRSADLAASVKAWRPPMGWNSWDSYGTTITEEEVLANARFMADHLKSASWDTLVIDAGSSNNREIVRERLFAEWNVEESFIGELIVWIADADDWADGTTSAHPHGCLWFALD